MTGGRSEPPPGPGIAFGTTPRSAAETRVLDRRDVDPAHLHHRAECPPRGCGVGVGDGLHQRDRRDLPRQAPLVLAPSALALLAAVADDGVPVAVGFGLVGGGDLERERLAVLEGRPAVEPEAGDAEHRELDGQHVTLPARRIVAGRAVDRADGRVGKGRGVEACSFLGVAVVPEADGVAGWMGHVAAPTRRWAWATEGAEKRLMSASNLMAGPSCGRCTLIMRFKLDDVHIEVAKPSKSVG